MNTIKSTIYGKAYEYACVLAIKDIVTKYRDVQIVSNDSLDIAKVRYQEISNQDREEMLSSATCGINAIIEMEPRIIEDGKDVLSISLQPDNVATQNGDIRDVLIIRRSIKWEIGISVKHNHAALKHSRLSQQLDFGKEWMQYPYWGFIKMKLYSVQSNILQKLNLFLMNYINLKNKEKIGET